VPEITSDVDGVFKVMCRPDGINHTRGSAVAMVTQYLILLELPLLGNQDVRLQK
jgi:hypothetical protein